MLPRSFLKGLSADGGARGSTVRQGQRRTRRGAGRGMSSAACTRPLDAACCCPATYGARAHTYPLWHGIRPGGHF